MYLFTAFCILFNSSSYDLLGDCMNEELDDIRRRMKQKKKYDDLYEVDRDKVGEKTSFSFVRYFSKFLFTVILTLVVMICLKRNTEFKTIFYKYVYDTHFNFAVVNKWYEKTFGSSIPFQDMFQVNTQTVFNEELSYSNVSDYNDGGALLDVSMEYLVPVYESGLVVFIGEKEGYGNTVIVQQINGVDLWYGNVSANVSMYDYIEKGSLLGNCFDTKLYLMFQKNGEVLDYHEYI